LRPEPGEGADCLHPDLAVGIAGNGREERGSSFGDPEPTERRGSVHANIRIGIAQQRDQLPSRRLAIRTKPLQGTDRAAYRQRIVTHHYPVQGVEKSTSGVLAVAMTARTLHTMSLRLKVIWLNLCLKGDSPTRLIVPEATLKR